MNATSTPLFRHVLSILAAAALLALTGCVDVVTGPEKEPEEEVVPQSTYDLALTTRAVNVLGSCDVTFGSPDDGEFQYRYEITGAGQSFERESAGFNTRLGQIYPRKAGESIDFTNRTYTWSGLDQPGNITVSLSGTEWDVAGRDGDMSNKGNSMTVPYESGKQTLHLDVGSGDCKIQLLYDATWTERTAE